MVKKWQRTADLLKQQLKENPNDSFSHYNLAVVYNNLKQYEKGFCHIEQALKSLIQNKPLILMSLFLKATLLCALKRFPEAEQACREALETHPEFIDCLMLLGQLLSHREDKCKEAIELFERYLKVDQSIKETPAANQLILNNLNLDHIAYFYIGNSYIILNCYQKAKSAYYKSLEIDPQFDFEPQHMEGFLKSFDEGATNDVKLTPNRENLLHNLAFTHVSLHEYEEGLQIYKKLLKIKPDHPGIYANIGSAMAELGRLEEGSEYLRKALEFDPNHADAKNNLSIVSLRLLAEERV